MYIFMQKKLIRILARALHEYVNLYTIQKNNTGPYRHAGMPVC